MLARLLGLTCRCTKDLAYEPPAVCGECGRWTASPWPDRLVVWSYRIIGFIAGGILGCWIVDHL